MPHLDVCVVRLQQTSRALACLVCDAGVLLGRRVVHDPRTSYGIKCFDNLQANSSPTVISLAWFSLDGCENVPRSTSQRQVAADPSDPA